jgi:prepilin-type N-terminal cleavage/methylation domain-containing protein
MLSARARAGFTMVEVIVALVILGVAVLGLSASAASLATRAADAELRARALHAVQDRLARIQVDPRYAQLDSLYDGIQTGALGLPGFTLTTTVTRVVQTTPTPRDFTLVDVIVAGPALSEPVQRQLLVAAP